MASGGLQRPHRREQEPAAAGWVPLGHPVSPRVGDLFPGELAKCPKVPFFGKNFVCLFVYLVAFGL